MVRNTMKRGFTLIELLVAISIIAIISTIGLTVYQGTQAQARDATRKNDLRQLGLALELYFQKNGQYITTGSSAQHSCDTDTDNFYQTILSFTTNQLVPKDPLTSQKYCYLTDQYGSFYNLCAKLENPDPGITQACQSVNYNYLLLY